MEAKIPKCQCLSMNGSSRKLADYNLTLNDTPIPFSNDPVRFLGLDVQVPKNNSVVRERILLRLKGMLVTIDQTPPSRKQKLCLCSGGVCGGVLATDGPGIPCYLDGAEGQPPGHRVFEDNYGLGLESKQAPSSCTSLNLRVS